MAAPLSSDFKHEEKKALGGFQAVGSFLFFALLCVVAMLQLLLFGWLVGWLVNWLVGRSVRRHPL